MTASSHGRLGAYGLVVRGIPGAASAMQPQASDAPDFDLEVEIVQPVGPGDTRSRLTLDSAQIKLVDGGWLRMDKGQDRASFELPHRVPDPELLHPYLAPAAALHWQWSGHEALHSGAFGVRDGVVLVLGDKAAGKSTTLARLATHHAVPVLTDDLAIYVDGRILPGPRTIDLRAAAGSDQPTATTPVRGDRHRLNLPGYAGSTQVLGVAQLAWTDRVGFSAVPLQERFNLLARQRTFPSLAADPVALLDLASVPMVVASRPKDLTQLDQFALALADYFS